MEIAKRASVEAGEKIMEIYDSSDFEIELKGDNSPLTRADKAAHHLIMSFLDKTEVPVLSEEGRDIPFEERSQWEYLWVVDPLDGTKEFIKRNGEFTVNIALVEGHEVVLGVVHVPVLDVTYYASKGEGAFVIKGKALAQPIQANEFTMADEGLRLVCSRSHRSDAVEEYLQQFTQPEIVSMGSSLKLVLVAEGKADIYPRLGPTMEWDTAAAQIVVEEAGGTVISQDTQEKVRYNKENLLNPYFIVFGQVNG